MASEMNKGEMDGSADNNCRTSASSSSDGQNEEEQPKNGSSSMADGNRTPSVRRKLRTLTFGRRYKTKNGSGKDLTSSKKRKGPWNFKFNYRLRREPVPDIPEPNVGCDSCVCTGYRRTEEHHLGAGVVFRAGESSSNENSNQIQGNPSPIIDLSRFNPEEYPIEDWEERARAERARELEEGVDPPPGYRPASPVLASPNPQQLSHLMSAFDIKLTDLAATLQSRLAVNPRYPLRPTSSSSTVSVEPLFSEINLVSQFVMSRGSCAVTDRTVHTQVDYIHCLVPDLLEITNCSFYWGKMDRYEAERLLETKPEGTFLLRDSAQEEYLFSVSFRRYSRSLHARIEQWNHKFSFDSHDPGVFASGTVCGLIEHYKDPTCCMFFEPMLTIPLHRTFPFPLQHLSRSVICKATTYDGINSLRLPKSLKGYLKEYHYKQRVRVRMFEVEH